MTLPHAALLAQIEAAECGSRELDLAVLNAVSPDAWRWVGEDRETITCDRYGPGAVGNPVCSLDPFTRSIDAALMLVPEGCSRRMEYLPAATWPYRVWIFRDAFMPLEDKSGRPVLGKTEALALVIAALRAQASTPGRDEAKQENGNG